MSDALTRFILVRHGRTEYNAQNRLQGRMDIPLAERGVRQAEAVAPVIAGMDPDVIVCSPLTRARQTARRIGRACGIDPVPDDRLMEIDVGRWGGLRVADLRREAPNLVAAREVGKDFRRPGGETGSEVMDRIAGDYSASRGLGGLSNCSWTLLDRFSNEESRARGLATPWRLRAYNCQV